MAHRFVGPAFALSVVPAPAADGSAVQPLARAATASGGRGPLRLRWVVLTPAVLAVVALLSLTQVPTDGPAPRWWVLLFVGLALAIACWRCSWCWRPSPPRSAAADLVQGHRQCRESGHAGCCGRRDVHGVAPGPPTTAPVSWLPALLAALAFSVVNALCTSLVIASATGNALGRAIRRALPAQGLNLTINLAVAAARTGRRDGAACRARRHAPGGGRSQPGGSTAGWFGPGRRATH